MFCTKCGSKTVEGAVFCQKCGAKIITDEGSPPAPAPPPTQPIQQLESEPEPQSTLPTTPSKSTTIPKPKKKSKKLIFGIVGVVVVVLVFIIAVSSGGDGGGEKTLFQIAEGVSPMTDAGFDSTYGEVFSWLMTNRSTKLDQQGDVAYLTFSGKVTGGEHDVSVTLKMTGLSANASNQRLEPDAMILNGVNVPDFNNPKGMLSDLFWGHDNRNDYKTFMDLVAFDMDNFEGSEHLSIYYGYGLDIPSSGVNTKDSVASDPESEAAPLDSDVFKDVLDEYINGYSDFDCAYALYDIDGNGVDELLVRYSDSMDEETKIYTYADGKTNGIGDFWSRNRLLLDGNGNIYADGSSGHDQSTIESMRISDDGTALITVETWQMDGFIYTHNSIDGTKVISEKEFQDACDSIYEATRGFVDTLSWQTLSTKVGDSGSEDPNPGEVLYKGKPIAHLFYGNPEMLTGVFGNPVSGTHIDGYLYDGGEFIGYEDTSVIFDYETGGVGWIIGSAVAYELQGDTLDKNRTELIELLGEPSYEAFVEYSGDYEMEYVIWEGSRPVVLNIAMTDANEKAHSVTITPYEDGISDEEYEAIVNANYIDGSFEWVEKPTSSKPYNVGGGWNQGYYIEPTNMGQMIEGRVKNVSGESYSYVQIMFTLFDSNGNQIGSAVDAINNLGADNTWKFSAIYTDTRATRFELAEISGW